jgi:hypothetical protein
MPDPLDPGSPSCGPERLEVRYELTEQDLVRIYWEGVLGRRHTLYRLVAFVIVLALVSGAAGGPIPAAGVVAAVAFLLGVALPWWTRRQARSNPAFRGPHTAWISPEGLGASSEGVGASELTWLNVEQVRATPSHLLLHWRGGVTTLVPRAAFAAPEDAERFVERAEAWRRAAQHARGTPDGKPAGP